jgi:hypothetical protein
LDIGHSSRGNSGRGVEGDCSLGVVVKSDGDGDSRSEVGSIGSSEVDDVRSRGSSTRSSDPHGDRVGLNSCESVTGTSEFEDSVSEGNSVYALSDGVGSVSLDSSEYSLVSTSAENQSVVGSGNGVDVEGPFGVIEGEVVSSVPAQVGVNSVS